MSTPASTKRADAARSFPANTCGASRHAQQIGEALVKGTRYPMLTEDPKHCGESVLATVTALYEARTALASERENAAQTVEALTYRTRWLSASMNSEPLKPCAIAAALRAKEGKP